MATRVGELSKVVTHRQTGLFFEPENSSALAEANIFLLDHLPLTIMMGQAGQGQALKHFIWIAIWIPVMRSIKELVLRQKQKVSDQSFLSRDTR